MNHLIGAYLRSGTVIQISFWLTLCTLAGYLAGIFIGRKWWGKICSHMLALNMILFLVNIFIGWTVKGRPPFQSLLESLYLLGFFLLLFGAWAGLVRGAHIAGLVASALVLLIHFYGFARPDLEPVFSPPALKSFWFVPHVISYFLAYSAFVFSSLGAIVVILNHPGKSRFYENYLGGPEFDWDYYLNKMAAIGFTALTIGLVLGSVWSKNIWFSYWIWDFKQVWAVITWLIFSVFLHCRYVLGWSGRKSSWLILLGLAVIIFTYLGLNFLPFSNFNRHTF
jgi:ABC-type transport system involved in cytochrome c biogenesis permease subunit